MSTSSPTRAADVLAEAAPLRLVLGVLVLPEPVVGRLAVDDRLHPEVVQELDLVRGRHHADRGAASVEHVLHGVGAEAPRGAPHQHPVTLLHVGAVLRHQHPVGGRVAQGVDRRLLPGQVGGLGHQLVGLHHRQVGQAAEVGLEPPDALVVGEHRVVVGARALVVDVVAVDGDLVARLPVAYCRPGPQDHTRGVGPDDVVVEGVALSPDALLARAGRGTRRWGVARRSRSTRC